MSRLSRRTMFKGSVATAGLAALGHLGGSRIIRAQGAAYEIVSFGPITEGAIAEGFFWPEIGSMSGISAAGIAFGNIATSLEKLTPTLFSPDGTLTKLKSGTLGAEINAMNAEGMAAGTSYDAIGGKGEDSWRTYGQPVAWIEGEFVRLPVPDPDPNRPFADVNGAANFISDDGTILGSGNSHNLLWRDGQPEILPTENAAGNGLSYYGLRPDGSLVVRSFDYASGERTLGILVDGEIEPMALSDAFAATDTPQLAAMNSIGEVLMYRWNSEPTGAMYVSNIVAPGQEPVVIDTRDEGIAFRADAFNADRVVVGVMQERAGADSAPAIWSAGELTNFETLLPSDHGYHGLVINGISDDGVISGSGWDEDGGFHPLLFVPA